MIKVDELRQQIGPDCRQVLSLIWSFHVANKTWPTTRRIYRDLRKDFVLSALKKTNGSIITEMNEGGSRHFQLFGAAPLLVDDAPQHRRLLTGYLEYLRDLYRTYPDDLSISHLRVKAALKLSDHELDLLYRLISVARLYGQFASAGPEGWSVGVLEASEDFPDGDLDETLDHLLLRSYNPDYIIFYDEQIARHSTSPSNPLPNTSSKAASPQKVFISYSHDSSEHKAWILDLATQLAAGGIKVILDEWHLELGADITKFMERAIAEADRVLLVCTEKYTEKVDSRRGGAGYEATMAVGELLESQDSTKFIPIVRQKARQPKMPRGLKTRLYVNLSHAANYQKEFDRLLRGLHGTSLSPEPTVGTNPYEC